jgi:hypothetical protein
MNVIVIASFLLIAVVSFDRNLEAKPRGLILLVSIKTENGLRLSRSVSENSEPRILSRFSLIDFSD